MPRFAANISTMFTEWDLLDRLDAAAEAGFRAVECQSPYGVSADALAARLSATGLTLALFNLPAGDWEAGERGLAALSDRFEAFRDGVAQGLDYALA
ncbi:MAG: hydroxypyruvate isomerase, partial [Ancalomicrobiaceae bacterium]|nr:hydroxypyruvate isomerase [Ancalomicrobiaceae bacterium]